MLFLYVSGLSVFFFTSKKQRDNEIWCSLHNARIFGLWTSLEPQQDLGQHLLHACLHQLHFQSICRDHSKSTLKASWVFAVFQTRKLNPWTSASLFFRCSHCFGFVRNRHSGARITPRQNARSCCIELWHFLYCRSWVFISLKSVSGT